MKTRVTLFSIGIMRVQVLAAEIVEDLQAALDQFALIAADLARSEVVRVVESAGDAGSLSNSD